MAYTAELRMPANATSIERQERVNHLLDLMKIRQSSHVLVGDTRFKGVSGGERKRLCIAMELLTRPLLLFLDEFSSGKNNTHGPSFLGLLSFRISLSLCHPPDWSYHPSMSTYVQD